MTSTAVAAAPVDGDGGKVNVKQWLQDNKLSSCLAIFTERDIEVEELTDFSDDELHAFAQTELSLDTLARKRFVKAIAGLRQSGGANSQVAAAAAAAPAAVAAPSSSSGSTGSTNRRPPKQVILSPAEHRGITKLFAQFDTMTDLHERIKLSLKSLDECQMQINSAIEVTVNNIMEQLQAKEQELLRDIESKHTVKKTMLEQQLNRMQLYQRSVDEGRHKYVNFMCFLLFACKM